MRSFLFVLSVLSVLSLASAADKPSFLFILCDDLGTGDVKALNPEGKIATPNMDRLAREGMIFTDAHTPSSVCSPTRYGTLTGRYNWRTKLQSGVLGGLSPRLIEQGRLTVASMLKAQGYHTAAIGKWHLGMDWIIKPGQTVAELNIESREQAWSVDFTQPHTNGPTSVGFDSYFGIAASLDMVPYVFIKDDRVTVQPTEDRELEMIQGEPKEFTRKGPAAPGFTGYEVLPTLTKKAVEYAKRGLRVVALAPGGVKTALTANLKFPEGLDRALMQKLMPLMELAEPDEIAAAVAYLASPEARYINGAILPVDGGSGCGDGAGDALGNFAAASYS